MRSSPKVIVVLGPAGAVPPPGSPPSPAPTPTSAPAPPPAPPQGNWTCGVCGFANPNVGGSVPPGAKCALCGVAYAMSKGMSLPPSRTTTPAPKAPTPASAPTSPVSASPAPVLAPTAQIACTACTFLNHPSLSACEICGTSLPKKAKDGEAPSSSTSTAAAARTETVRFSFRRGGEREAYRRLKGVLSDKVWERAGISAVRDTRGGGGGIDAILKSISLEGQANDAHMQDAFRDLEVLMVRAGEMVRLAQSLNAKLTAAGAKDDAEATLVRSSLVRLGLPAPALTQDMVRDERAYFDGLARELGALLTGAGGAVGLMLQPGHGVIALDTVWGLWMRARGVALLPPATLMSVLPLLPAHTAPPIRRLDLPSGLTVLSTPGYAPGVLLARLRERMAPGAAAPRTEEEVENEHGLGIIDIAAAEGLPIGLATELVDMVAALPDSIVRDDQAGPGGSKWYRDIISGWPLAQPA
ncbi:uncharacterized protein COLE_05295 [Cutaneotrichosporon oleaginosum]|nr:hypothetical protein COLE_05295 [Cutaneotrichosporon oleaginosum]